MKQHTHDARSQVGAHGSGEAVEDANQDADDRHLVPGRGRDVRYGRVGGAEDRLRAATVQQLEGRLPVDADGHDLAVFRGLPPCDEGQVAVVDALADHGLARDLDGEDIISAGHEPLRHLQDLFGREHLPRRRGRHHARKADGRHGQTLGRLAHAADGAAGVLVHQAQTDEFSQVEVGRGPALPTQHVGDLLEGGIAPLPGEKLRQEDQQFPFAAWKVHARNDPGTRWNSRV